MNNNESFEIRYDKETGCFEEAKEPYITIEVPTEEDFNYIQEALALKKNESEQWKDTGLIAQYADENKRLKELLLRIRGFYYQTFSWDRFEAEAKELLGEDGETE